MIVTVSFEYFTRNVIPPRCRNPRTVYAEEEALPIEVSEVTGTEAPVAFRVPDRTMGPAEYRWWEQSLWIPYLPWSHQTEPSIPGSKHFPAELTLGGRYGDGRDAALEQVREHFADYLIVDGIVWCRTSGEPMYSVTTYGFGGNNSTALMVSDSTHRHVPEDSFRADQLEAARDRALAIALARQDDESVYGIRNTEPIEVLIPDAIRCDPQGEALVARAAEELAVRLPRSIWQDVAARIAVIPELQEVRATILASI